MERRSHFNETPGVSGELSVEFDIERGHIRTSGSGFWSLRQTRAFFVDWNAIVRAVHVRHLAVSALVDLSRSGVQASEVADQIATATEALYRDGDAIAMLVPSSLAKMQMRRVLDTRFHAFFISRGAAENWLESRQLGGARSEDRAVLAPC